jgi:hypothetical protein
MLFFIACKIDDITMGMASYESNNFSKAYIVMLSNDFLHPSNGMREFVARMIHNLKI